MTADTPFPALEFDDKILAQGAGISWRLDLLRTETFPPNAQKSLRKFAMAEVARFLGVSQGNSRVAQM